MMEFGTSCLLNQFKKEEEKKEKKTLDWVAPLVANPTPSNSTTLLASQWVYL